jgi:hypothetical protein
MSAGGDTVWVDRAPKQSKAMKAAYAGLAEAEEWLRGCDKENVEEHADGVEAIVAWHAEIGRIALKGA